MAARNVSDVPHFSDLSGTARIKCLQKGQPAACFKKPAQSPQGAFSTVWTPQGLQCWEAAAMKKPCYKQIDEILLYWSSFSITSLHLPSELVVACKKPLYASREVMVGLSTLPSFGYTHGKFYSELNTEMSLRPCFVCHLAIWLSSTLWLLCTTGQSHTAQRDIQHTSFPHAHAKSFCSKKSFP